MTYSEAEHHQIRHLFDAKFASEDWHGWAAQIVDLPHTARVLDVGSGDGAFWHKLLDWPDGLDLTIMDPSPAVLAEFTKQLAKCDRAITESLVADLQTWQPRDRCYDRVLALQACHHLTDPVRAIATLARAITRDGIVYLSTAAPDDLALLKRICREALGVAPGDEYQANWNSVVAQRQLKRHFSKVRRHSFMNRLAVSDAEDLCSYLVSMLPAQAIDRAQRETLFWALHAAIKTAGGVLRIGRHLHLFVCSQRLG